MPALWQVTRLKGAVEPWVLWDCPHYHGIGRVVSQMLSALTAAENAARKLYDEDKKTKPSA